MKIEENLGNFGKSRKITKFLKIHGNARKFVKIKKIQEIRENARQFEKIKGIQEIQGFENIDVTVHYN